jgi:hypothetical protein
MQDGADRQQFRDAVKRLLEQHQAIKQKNTELKQLRAEMNELKTIVMAFMQDASLDECNVSHNGHSNTLAVRTSKRTTALKKDNAIECIQKYLSEKMGIDDSANAPLIWEAMQSTRTVSTTDSLAVRKS